MQAFAETLDKKWTNEWNIEKLQFNQMQRGKNKGRLTGQDSRSKETPFNIFYILYIDDGTFMFDSREDLIKGTNMLYEHFKMFGLSMHIGKDGKKSKTEAMYISPNIQEDEQNFLNADFETPIPVKSGYVNFTKKFKYLGSFITHDLKDDLEISIRIKKAKGQIGALKFFLSANRSHYWPNTGFLWLYP